MGETNIGWTDFSFNPWIGCEKVSKGCQFCYAEDLAENRMGYNGKVPERPLLWGAKAPRRPASETYWKNPLLWNRKAQEAGVRKRVFCASMADVFEDHPDLPLLRLKLWPLILATPNLDWLLLTKRPENFERMLPGDWMRVEWPRNVWMGVSVENGDYKWRVDVLRRVGAKVRFLSVEPLIGPVGKLDLSGISWVIVGAESGANRRPMDLDWARSIRDQCVAAQIPFFYKQGNSRFPGQDRLLDGRLWEEFPKPIL